jgi:hypothetical protein
MLTFAGHWHTREVCSSRMNASFHGMHGVVWARGLLMSTL